jgi:hypothetical protein
LPRARITAPVLHASLFGLTSILFLIPNKGLLDGLAGIFVAILWTADIPFSVIASNKLISNDQFPKVVWAIWGVIGTAWWYFLGISIDAWKTRLSRNT